jgi:GTPase SAR1 family protein
MPSNKEFTFKIVMVGNRGVGCRSLLAQTTTPSFTVAFSEEFGTNIAVSDFIFPPLQVRLVVWNILDISTGRFLRKFFSRGANGILYVFNVRDQSSFEAIPKWRNEIQSHQSDLPAVLVGTHIDQPEQRVVSFYEAAKFAEAHHMPYFDTSIHNGPTLTNPLRTLTYALAKRSITQFGEEYVIQEST